jgi:Pentapeptide repeats (8 copies)
MPMPEERLEEGELPTADDIETEVQALSGSNLAGSNLAGSNLAGSNLAGVNLAGSNMGGLNLSGTNLAGSNLAGTNLGGNNLAGSNLAGSNLAGSNLAGSNLAGSNLAGSNLAGSNLAGSNLAGTNTAGNNLAGSNLSSTTLSSTTTGRNIHSLASSNGMLYSAEDVWTPKTSQCVVMGIGSTAFAKLLNQQTANTRIRVALGKLPWGFANSAGGSLSLRAWEAIVWGDKTYCVFILTAPSSATWPGVAGFIKAVFRWNAPPTQSMDISGIEAAKTYDSTTQTSTTTYTGMMNAAAKWNAGLVSAKNHLAGALGFITATTNDVSVMVDFSSWVMDTTKTGLVLGNVQSSGAPTYAESVYYVVDNGNDNVSVRVSAAAPRTFTVFNPSDAYDDIRQALWSHQANPAVGPKPIPRRCGGALFLKWMAPSDTSFASLAASKCDAGLGWTSTDARSGDRDWKGKTGTTSPMNAYMRLPASSTVSFMRGGDTGTAKPVLSETYVHLWEQSYDYPVTSTTCAAAYSQTKCSTYVAGVKVSRNGRNYIAVNGNAGQCASYAACSPGSTGCSWGLVWNDNGACN